MVDNYELRKQDASDSDARCVFKSMAAMLHFPLGAVEMKLNWVSVCHVTCHPCAFASMKQVPPPPAMAARLVSVSRKVFCGATRPLRPPGMSEVVTLALSRYPFGDDPSQQLMRDIQGYTR